MNKKWICSILEKKFTDDIQIQNNKWNLTEPLWIREHIHEISDPKLEVTVTEILEDFLEISERLNNLPHYWIHNDLNDLNILVEVSSDGQSTLSGILDFGDLSKSPTICNLAICSSYLLIVSGSGS